MGRGGCGGEAVIAGFSSDALVAKVGQEFETTDPLWSIVEMVPLLKR